MSIKKIAIFASGSGSNAEQIINYFHSNPEKNIEVTLVLTNNATAFVLDRAKRLNVATHIFDRNQLNKSDHVIEVLQDHEIDLIVLAGFLWLIPANLIQAFPDQIVNIHPALLPKYGGKGMYGEKVHQAVVANRDEETGITIHLVDEIYDNGKILIQARCSVDRSDTPDDVAKKIHTLEYDYFPITLEKYLITGL